MGIVGEVDDPDEEVGEADDLDEVVGEAEDPNVALLGLHTCVYKEISCAPRLPLIKKTPIRKGFRKIHRLKRFSPIRKELLDQGMDFGPTLL